MKKGLAITLATVGIIAVAGGAFALSGILPIGEKKAQPTEKAVEESSISGDVKEIVIDDIDKMDVPREKYYLDEIINQKVNDGDKYIPQTILELKWGTSPGEIDYTAFEGEFHYPSLFMVDEQGHLWFLDTFNNRIQHFNDKGRFINELKVKSFKTSLDKAGYKSADILIKKWFIDEKENFWLYTPQDRVGACAPIGFNKDGKPLGRKSFNELDKLIDSEEKSFTFNGESYSVNITDLQSNDVDLESKCAIVKKNGKILKEILFETREQTKGRFLGVDKKGYLFVYEKDRGEIVRINIFSGTLEGRVEQKNLFGSFIDGNGNIYVLTKLNDPDPRIRTSIGRKIVKWSLLK